MAENIIKKFRISGDSTVYEILPDSAVTAESVAFCENADYANVASTIEGEGYSIGMSSKGNLEIVSGKKINFEPSDDFQFKIAKKVVFDVAHRVASGSDEDARIDFINDEKIDDPEPNNGAVPVKLQGRSFDIRCFNHGGIALQPAGRDSDGFENKIKFESSRKVSPDVVATASDYVLEGGKGVEFGTFNNLHTSIFTGDYRFKGDAKVYGVTRGEIYENDKHKFDYPTQADDFKDIIPTECEEGDEYKVSGATWNEIVKVARNYADGKISGGGSGGTIDPEIWAQKSWVETNFATKESVPEGIPAMMNEVNFLKSRTFLKDNGNLEMSAAGLKKIDKSGTTLDEAASLDLVGDDKVALKCKEIEMSAPVMSWAMEISKKNKVTIGDGEYYPVAIPSGTPEEIAAAEELNKAATYEQMKALFPVLGLNIEKNNSTTAEIAALGTGFTSVNILDLVTLAGRVIELEAKCADFERRISALENPQTEPEPEVEPEVPEGNE